MSRPKIVMVPSVPFGPAGIEADVEDAKYYRDAARNIRIHKAKGTQFAGANLTETVALLCEAAADALDGGMGKR